MLPKILTSGLFAGFCAGLIAALLQLIFVQPVLLHAELYEGGDLIYNMLEGAPSQPDIPGFDAMRDGLSVLFSALIYVGYGLILVAFMSIANAQGIAISAHQGIVWGLAGFVTIHLAPSFSLPPEVPGMASADLAARQVWWWGTAVATGVGLALIAFGRSALFMAAGAVPMVAPHLLGAPEPAVFTGPLPPEVASLFAVRALGVSMAAWATLGLFAAYFWQRETQDA